uniref:FRIGIDA-like protein n=1 Tax=Anthurium amnicola TaxID=1678845 RepID=A0A1D1YZC1_9ARAE
MAPAKPKAAAAEAVAAKEGLKKAFEELQTHSSFLSSFTVRWKNLEDHMSSVERSIEDRIRVLESGEMERPAAAASSEKGKPAPAAAAEEEPEVDPRPELKSLCVNMDGKGLLVFIKDNRTDLLNIYKELNRAIRAAPDPGTLVLDAMDGFYPAKRSREDTYDGGLHANRRTCLCLLEHLHMISPEIKPSVRDRVKKLASEWNVKMTPDAAQNNVQVSAFLQLLVSFGIASDFEEGDLLDLLVSIAKKKEAIGLCRNLGLSKRMADIVQKLSSKGKQLDAVRFVHAFDLADKFPAVPLVKAYLKESKRFAQELLKKGNNSAKSQNAAIARELDAVKAAIRVIEECKLESEYSPEGLQKRVTQLEQQRAEKKRLAASAVPTNSKAQAQKQAANKRPRPSTGTATAVVAGHTLPTLSQMQPQFPLADRAPYMASTVPYDLPGSSHLAHLYDPTASIYKRTLLDLGAMRSPPRSFVFSDPHAGSVSYDRPGTYGSYSLSVGMPPKYPSLYP